jgi:hypothetical protein
VGTSGHSGGGANEIYSSKWPEFKEMQFLNDLNDLFNFI